MAPRKKALEDDDALYKLNTNYMNCNNLVKRSDTESAIDSEEDVFYKFPDTIDTPVKKPRRANIPRTKVNFWSSCKKLNRRQKREKANRRHTIAVTEQESSETDVTEGPKPSVILDNNDPMVTVPDDVVINLDDDILRNNTRNQRKRSKKTRGTKRSLNGTEKQQPSDNEVEFFSKYIEQKLRRMETNQRIFSENLVNTVLMLGQLGKLNIKSKVIES